MIRILIVDNHILFREGLQALLSKYSEISVIGTFNHLNDVIEKLKELNPDIILLGITEANINILNTVKGLTLTNPETKIVILSQIESEQLMLAAIRSGAKGFLPTDISVNKLLTVLRAIGNGEVAISRRMISHVIDDYCRLSTANVTPDYSTFNKLTFREREILQLLAASTSNDQISKKLFIAENTVKIHIHHILKKLKLKNRSEAAYFARNHQSLLSNLNSKTLSNLNSKTNNNHLNQE